MTSDGDGLLMRIEVTVSDTLFESDELLSAIQELDRGDRRYKCFYHQQCRILLDTSSRRCQKARETNLNRAGVSPGNPLSLSRLGVPEQIKNQHRDKKETRV
jgi:hypothetical protein